MGITACDRCAAAARISATTRTKPAGMSIIRYGSILPTYRDGLHHHVGIVAARREAAKLQRCASTWRGDPPDQKSGLSASGSGKQTRLKARAAAGFTGTFEICCCRQGGGGRVKRRPICAGRRPAHLGRGDRPRRQGKQGL